ncbi:hypothetical protein D5R40_33170 [Okeania hirsuta]|uniref:Response regulator n=1 Tax=Okeania hirsuta TaxID=1458930 RepID=A0A3N6NP33_9CYAN|nr:hypothetical protein D5R40_33170 [Okeania hirsuta]
MEATRLIRERWPADKQPYIIAMTANAFAGDKREVLAMGITIIYPNRSGFRELVVALAKCKPIKV